MLADTLSNKTFCPVSSIIAQCHMCVLNMRCAYKWWKGEEEKAAAFTWIYCAVPSFIVNEPIFKAVTEWMMGNSQSCKSHFFISLHSMFSIFLSVCRWRVTLANCSKAFTVGCCDAKQSSWLFNYTEEMFVLFKCFYDLCKLESLHKSQALTYACWTNALMSLLQQYQIGKIKFWDISRRKSLAHSW